MFKRILVPIDFGEPSKYALQLAVELAKQYGASLTLLHAWEIPAYADGAVQAVPVDFITPFQDAAQDTLDLTLAKVQKDVPAAKGILRQGSPWREIMATIEKEHPDLVVMGTHGRHGLGRVVFGSVAEKVVRHSPVTVIIARGERPIVTRKSLAHDADRSESPSEIR